MIVHKKNLPSHDDNLSLVLTYHPEPPFLPILQHSGHRIQQVSLVELMASFLSGPLKTCALFSSSTQAAGSFASDQVPVPNSLSALHSQLPSADSRYTFRARLQPLLNYHMAGLLSRYYT